MVGWMTRRKYKSNIRKYYSHRLDYTIVVTKTENISFKGWERGVDGCEKKLNSIKG